MREIKFRAYDDFQKKYVFVGFHIVGEVTCFGGMEHVIQETAKERMPARGYKTTLEAWNDFSFEQFTGVRDKDGKDIYFGDLVRAPSGNIFEVIWYEDEMRIALKYKDTIYNFNAGLYELVGNIHENPELLK
jgi:hypothetical protein